MTSKGALVGIKMPTFYLQSLQLNVNKFSTCTLQIANRLYYYYHHNYNYYTSNKAFLPNHPQYTFIFFSSSLLPWSQQSAFKDYSNHQETKRHNRVCDEVGDDQPSRSTRRTIAVAITHSYPATHTRKLSRYIDTLAVREADLNSLSCRRGESLSQATRHISWTTEASIKHTGSQARCGRQQASNALMRGTFFCSLYTQLSS